MLCLIWDELQLEMLADPFIGGGDGEILCISFQSFRDHLLLRQTLDAPFSQKYNVAYLLQRGSLLF